MSRWKNSASNNDNSTIQPYDENFHKNLAFHHQMIEYGMRLLRLKITIPRPQNRYGWKHWTLNFLSVTSNSVNRTNNSPSLFDWIRTYPSLRGFCPPASFLDTTYYVKFDICSFMFCWVDIEEHMNSGTFLEH